MPRRLLSTISSDGTLELSVGEYDMPEPGDDQVVIEVAAAPINPSDLGAVFGPADMRTARTTESGSIVADVPEAAMGMVGARLDIPLPIGNEGAGTVVAAGSSDAAQALLGRTVATIGGGMYAEFRLADAAACLPLPDGVTARDGASCFVNPLTVLGFIETMRLDGHTAMVHTAAASNLGQMLVKACANEDIPLVNIVRRQEHVDLLRSLGAEHVCNSSDDDFTDTLKAALEATDATLGFDATGGGELAGTILGAMEAVQNAKEGAVGRYGSTRHKQVYIYGGLDRSPTVLRRNFGMAWSLGGWLMPYLLERVGAARADELRAKVAAEITTTFASSYTAEISLDEALDLETMMAYGRQATGEKYLVSPQKSSAS